MGLAVPPFCAALDVDTDLEGNSVPRGTLARDGILALCDDHPAQKTGNPIGIHVWGRLTERRAYGTHYGNVPVTIRGVGNQVVVAPSVHQNGQPYEWIRELPPDPKLLPDFEATMFRHVPLCSPALVRDIAATSRIYLQRKVSELGEDWRARVSAAWLAELEDPEVIFPVSRRHDALLWLSWHLTVCGAAREEVTDSLYHLAYRRCSPDGRFSAKMGSPEGRHLAREISDLVRDSKRRYEAQMQ